MSIYKHEGPSPGRVTAGLIDRGRSSVWVAVDRLPNGQVGVYIAVVATDPRDKGVSSSVWIRASELDKFKRAIAKAEEIVRNGTATDADATGDGGR